MAKKGMVAMLLAGGQGNRLYVLTKQIAKPAIPFGGKYRIIDFPLSNCSNSGVDTVGVLTQYQPLELNSYIGNGQPWDLDRLYGGVYILPPYTGGPAGWYKGTANAIFQNKAFIEQYDPEYVLILSGDHIYKMDYSKMLNYHKSKNATATISVLEVSMEEASRFGIMNTDENLQVYEFEEKPKEPKSNKASMGVYIFTWDKLKEHLNIDEMNEKSSNDFGNDIIPSMINAGEKVYAYPFEGYWKDVGTINSLWEANMDLLKPDVEHNLRLRDRNWKIYSRDSGARPHYVGQNAEIVSSIVAEGCDVNGKVINSVVFSGVTIGENSTIEETVVMKNVKIGKNVKIYKAIIADGVEIQDNAIIGKEQEDCEGGANIAVVGSGAIILEGHVIEPEEMIDSGSSV